MARTAEDAGIREMIEAFVNETVLTPELLAQMSVYDRTRDVGSSLTSRFQTPPCRGRNGWSRIDSALACVWPGKRVEHAVVWAAVCLVSELSTTQLRMYLQSRGIATWNTVEVR